MVRRPWLLLGGMMLLGPGCLGASSDELVEPPDDRYLWAVINAMTISDWASSWSLSLVLEYFGDPSVTFSDTGYMIECEQGAGSITADTISCSATLGFVSIPVRLEGGILDVQVIFERWLDEERASFYSTFGNWDGSAHMRGQVTTDDDGAFVIVFATDVDLLHIFPYRTWDAYGPGGLDEPFRLSRRSAARRARHDLQAADPTGYDFAEERCEVRFEGVSATYRVTGGDFTGVVTGSPSASCEDDYDGARFAVLCDWFNVDVTDTGALLESCRHVATEQ